MFACLAFQNTYENNERSKFVNRWSKYFLKTDLLTTSSQIENRLLYLTNYDKPFVGPINVLGLLTCFFYVRFCTIFERSRKKIKVAEDLEILSYIQKACVYSTSHNLVVPFVLKLQWQLQWTFFADIFMMI